MHLMKANLSVLSAALENYRHKKSERRSAADTPPEERRAIFRKILVQHLAELSGAEILALLADAQELRKRAKAMELSPGEAEEWGAIYHHAEAHKDDKPLSILRVQLKDEQAAHASGGGAP
jgi:hypothetical protein